VGSKHIEHVEMSGHIIDSLLLPKVLDAILTRGATYEIQDFQLGTRQGDPSHVRLEVRADSAAVLDKILAEIHSHGAVSVHPTDCTVIPADVDGAFPEGFYCSTNFRTQVRLKGDWVEVEDQEMDCGIMIDPEGGGGSDRRRPPGDSRLPDRIRGTEARVVRVHDQRRFQREAEGRERT